LLLWLFALFLLSGIFENVIVVVVVSNGIVLAGVDNGVVELFGALVNARTWSLQMRIGVRYEQVLTAIV